MHFGFVLDMSDVALLKIDLLDQRYTHSDLLDTDIPSKHFVCLQDVLKTSSRHVFKTSSKYVFKVSSRHVFKTSWRCLQRNNFSSSKTSCETSSKTKNCYAEDVLKTSSRHVLKTSQVILKINKCLLGSLLIWWFVDLNS